MSNEPMSLADVKKAHEALAQVSVPIITKEQVIELAAQVAHEANRAWCDLNGDPSQKPWNEAPEWQRHSAVRGVEATLRGETSEQLHESWMRDKLAAGWVYGPEKQPDAQPPTHPCLVPYADLPPVRRVKDVLFRDVTLATLVAINRFITN